MTTIEPLLKPDDVAAELGVSRVTVYRLINAGDLATVAVGESGAKRITRKALDAYKAKRDRERERVESLLTIDEVGQVLGISRASVYRLIRSGDLTTIQVGSRPRVIRVSRTALDKYITTHTEEKIS